MTFGDSVRKTVVRGGTSPLYLASGHLIYVNKGTLFAIGFDVDNLETRGSAVPVVDDVKFDPQTSAADIAGSRDGTLVYRAGPGSAASTSSTVQWISANDRRALLTPKPGNYRQFRLSPDSRFVALTVDEGNASDIWIFDTSRSTMTKRTFTKTGNSPIWSRDGRYLVFASGSAVWWMRADGAGEPQILLQGNSIHIPSSFSPDGRHLAFIELAASGPTTRIVPVEETNGQLNAGSPGPFAPSRFITTTPEFSPNGRWVAYVSNESGRTEVYVRPFPASEQRGRTLVSTEGGITPRWSPDGRELLYVSGGRLMSVNYSAKDDVFTAGEPRIRIDKLGGTLWDLTRDGRIAVLTSVDTPGPLPRDHTVVFLQNFFDHLRRIVPPR